MDHSENIYNESYFNLPSLTDFSDTNKSDPHDENVQLLKSMGFLDESEIRQALEISKNDLNEALSILTSERALVPTSLPVPSNNLDTSKTSELEMDLSEQNFDQTKFPFECLLTLESSIFSDTWSISYKKNEWLDRLLKSSIYLTQTNQFENDDFHHYNRFVTRGLPECFKKLLDSIAVNKWNEEIQQGVYQMTIMCIELIATKLKSTNNNHDNLDIFMQILGLIFNRENVFLKKNSLRLPNEEIDMKFTKLNETRNGWLIDFINLFGNQNGFDVLFKLLETSDLNLTNLFLKPISVCIEYLNVDFIKSKLEEQFKRLIELISSLETGEHFKDKNAAKVFDLLETMKRLSAFIWPDDVNNFNLLHLKIVLSMLKYSHFNSKMNSLKEICKLIENSKTSLKEVEIISEVDLSEWLVNEKVLSLAIEGNIDQAQYCDKIKIIVEFIGDRISQDEIKTLWSMQFNKSMSLIDNLYSLISIASTKFNEEQFDYLIEQIKLTWSDETFKSHDKLLLLFRMIGQDSKIYKTYSKILETLWILKDENIHQPLLIQQIYKEHLNVLSAGRLSRDQSKSLYLKKCLEQIKIEQGLTLKSIYSLKHSFEILLTYKNKSWTSSKNLKDILSEIVVPEIKSICQSLLNYNSNRNESILNTFKHSEIIDLHLNLIKFILKEGNLYLKLVRAQELWDCLVGEDLLNSEKCFEWFIECILDINESTRTEILKGKILNLDAAKLTLKSYELYKLYFLYYNQSESKINIISDSTKFLVEDADLDLVYLWNIILSNSSNEIVDLSIKFLIDLSYSSLSMGLKRDIHNLNLKFIQNVFSRLKENQTDELVCENLLKCLEEFILVVNSKENNSSSSSGASICHFNSIKIDKFNLRVKVIENGSELEIKNLFSNDLLIDLRSKLSKILSNSTSNFQIFYHDMRVLPQSNDHKSLQVLEIDGTNHVVCKIIPSTPVKSNEFFTSSTNSATPTSTSSLFSNRLTISSTLSDPKKHLPSSIISSNPESYEIFDKLLNHKSTSIANRVRNILNLLPTNPKLTDSFDSIVILNNTSSSSSLLDSTQQLKSYFNLNENSLHKILYNLETLSIRLKNHELFKQSFLKLNGLQVLIDLLNSLLNLSDPLEEELDNILINLIDYVLIDEEKPEPDVKKILLTFNQDLIEILFKIFIKKSLDFKFNTKLSIKSINLIYNLVCTNSDQISELIDSNLFRVNTLNVLIGSKSMIIRQNLADFFLKLANLNDSIKFKLINLVLKNTRLPIWINSTKYIRLSARDLIQQSSEYFNLLSSLLENLSPKILSLDKDNDLNSQKMLSNQINWFRMFNLTINSSIDQILLRGHFKLTKSILTNCSMEIKNSHGEQLIELLFKSFLFSAFFNSNSEILEDETLRLGYDILVELARENKANLDKITQYLIEFNKENKLTEWNYTQLVNLKSPRQKYIGLKNGGATCYMNSVLQQLFMIPGISDYIHMIGKSIKSDLDKDLFYELENVFMHLKKSNQEFFMPDKFWSKFRMWNSHDSINVREQQDAFDFFISLTDQIDEYLQKESIKKEPIFKTIFEGMYSNQFICQDCEHSYDRQESFLALNLSVKTFSNLEQSMSQFVKDELLTGDNSYFCEKCNLKRSAIKRTCLKKLPKYLCIQLKRFDYDWESNRSLKFDDHFEFPLSLNVKPYTFDYLNSLQSQNNTEYELSGIIVHSGQANAGHYYSFIKDLFTENPFDSFDEEFPNEDDSKWFKFNDTQVEEINFNDQFLIEECFGGNFTKSDWSSSNLPEERTRYWNAYMLFYKHKSYDPREILEKNTCALKEDHKEKIQFRDSISELSDLVEKCDNRVVGDDNRLENEIRIENLNLLKQNLILNQTYFNFVFNLCEKCLANKPYETIQITFNFLFLIYFKVNSKLRESISLAKWLSLFDTKKNQIYEAILYFFEKYKDLGIVKNYILDNPVEDVRIFMVNLIHLCLTRLDIENYYEKLNFVLVDLIELIKGFILTINLNEIFKIIFNYTNLSSKHFEHVCQNEVLVNRIVSLLTESNPLQLKDYPILFEMFSSFILKSNVLENEKNESIENFGALTNIIKKNLFNPESTVLLKQIVNAFENINLNHLKQTTQLIEKCCSINEKFNYGIIKQILLNINNSNFFQYDIKQVIQLLQNIILIDDDLQLKRLKLCLEGDNGIGLLALIRTNQNTDAKKSYNCVKLIVNLANQSSICKEYLLKIGSDWEWSVNWLKSKMSENTFEPTNLNLTINSNNLMSNIKSNESTGTKTFHRTKSAQATLDCAMDLLNSNSLDI
ncbi:unnamed protein product [Brachionus calyciflorus]|uniref:Ubiquitinyl hydrolase 1 n=1 Tax=Brachionus calyciflorus TaxID=104777 RepID=A0A813T1V0_9BILA|nr:unnamed protein product [Brachionus calyciflorus]